MDGRWMDRGPRIDDGSRSDVTDGQLGSVGQRVDRTKEDRIED